MQTQSNFDQKLNELRHCSDRKRTEKQLASLLGEQLQARGLDLETLIFGAEKAREKKKAKADGGDGSVPPSPPAAAAPPADGHRDEI